MENYKEILNKVQHLTPQEQLKLLEDLKTITCPTYQSSESKKSDRWRGFLPKRIDALEFQQQIRREWDA